MNDDDPVQLLLHLTGMAAEEKLSFEYRLHARASGTVSAAPARVYEYYDPNAEARTPSTKLTIHD